MALVEIKFDVAGEAQYVRAFEVMEQGAKDLTDPLTEIGEDLRQRVGQQFLTEGAAGGQPWDQLSPDYEVWKEAHFPGNPILVATGDMRAAALSPKAVHVEPHRMTYEVDDEKAIYHQRKDDPDRALPQRKLVELTSEMRRAWDRIFHDWVNGLRHGPIAPSRS